MGTGPSGSFFHEISEASKLGRNFFFEEANLITILGNCPDSLVFQP
jgi:hypothetical protein